jgi:putative DeoR family transcriptional regulator, stage III sporulation protein D
LSLLTFLAYICTQANKLLQTYKENVRKGIIYTFPWILLISNLGRASSVHDYIKDRTIKIGKYIVETKKTVRVIAKEFGVSKSTVHKDLTERLPEINPELANEVKEILDYHKSIRHLRGGEATKLKYKKEEETVK